MLWLVAVVAFVLPSLGAVAHPSMAMAPAAPSSLADCPDHAPPPDCPEEGTAKHATGQCCPLMACATALLPSEAVPEISPRVVERSIFAGRSLAGIPAHQDTPPPKG